MTHSDVKLAVEVLSFGREYSEVAQWLARKVAPFPSMEGKGDRERYAYAQIVAWMRHSLTHYDADSNAPSSDGPGELLQEHDQKCPVCLQGGDCEARDVLVDKEIAEEEYEYKEFRWGYNSEVRGILASHQGVAAHPHTCVLCEMWRSEQASGKVKE